jgi:predicted DNA-binding transcriptional regulator AlpA
MSVETQNKYLKDTSVAIMFDIDRSTVWRWASDGRLPPPKKIHGVTRWLLSEIEDWERQEFRL